MASYKEFPIVDITQENVNVEWSHLIASIESSTFISLDIEMTGLGNRKNLNVQ